MAAFILTGHGNFASGLHSSMKLIVGEQSEVYPIDFTEDLGSEDLKKIIADTVDKTPENDVIVLCDLAGGTPFNMSVMVSTEKQNKKIKVIAGANLAMVLDVALSKNDVEIDALLEQAKETGISGIAAFETKAKTEQISDDDGI